MQNQKLSFVQQELKINFKPPVKTIDVGTPEEAYQIFLKLWDKQLLSFQEQFYALFLNKEKELLCWRLLHTGCYDSCPVDIRILRLLAVTTMCDFVVVAHNHPVGTPFPSNADIITTVQLKNTLQSVGIRLHDHLIITENEYFSFRVTDEWQSISKYR